ncbi:MAG: cobalt transporter CbiM [candidate division WOR-3 bacterium]
MHIPDGYLSPSTCAVLAGGSIPFLVRAFVWIRKRLASKTVPILALTTALSFVIQMFNIPLPGGTTGHAVGGTLIAALVGPWPTVMAVSIVLIIQALIFGDGGILALGANIINMAVILPLSGYWLYRLMAGGSGIASPRRVISAAIASYIAINLAALAAAVEFGIQPALFKDATGAPLYCPYGLGVAIPAMMIGHLAIAGLAEALITGVVFWFVAKNFPERIRRDEK